MVRNSTLFNLLNIFLSSESLKNGNLFGGLTQLGFSILQIRNLDLLKYYFYYFCVISNVIKRVDCSELFHKLVLKANHFVNELNVN